MAGQTNIIVDGSSEMALVKSILDYVDKHLNGSPGDKLKKEMAAWLGDKGLDACYLTIVKNQVAGDLEKKLIDAKMPYIPLKTPVGVAFVVRDIDREAFLQLQYDVLSMRPEFYAACSVDQALDRAKDAHQQQMARIHVGTQAQAEELIARINQEGKGVVATICHDPKKGPFEYDVLVNVDDAIKKNGADIVRMELQWALKEGDFDICNFRSDQAAYDLNEMKIMLSELGKGHGVAIVDQMNGSNMRVEITPNGAVFYKKDAYDSWNQDRKIPDDEEFTMPEFNPNSKDYDTPDNKRRLAQFEMALRAGMKDINNMRVVPIAEADAMCRRSDSQVNEDIKEINKHNKKYEYGGHQDNSSMFVPVLDPNRPCRPNVNEKDELNNTSLNERQKELYKWYKDKGDKMIEAVNNEAHKQAFMVPGFTLKRPEEQRKIITTLAIEILAKKELPAIKEYLQSPNAPAGVAVYYKNMQAHFADQKEREGLAVDFVTTKMIEEESSRYQDYFVEVEIAEDADKRPDDKDRDDKDREEPGNNDDKEQPEQPEQPEEDGSERQQ